MGRTLWFYVMSLTGDLRRRCCGCLAPSSFPRRHRMLRFPKRAKKSYQSEALSNTRDEIPLGIGPALDLNIESELGGSAQWNFEKGSVNLTTAAGINYGGGPQVELRDSRGGRLGVSTSAARHYGGVTGPCILMSADQTDTHIPDRDTQTKTRTRSPLGCSGRAAH